MAGVTGPVMSLEASWNKHDVQIDQNGVRILGHGPVNLD